MIFELIVIDFSKVWTKSADDKFVKFFFLFFQKIELDISCKLSPLDEMLSIVFWVNKENKCHLLFKSSGITNFSLK